MSKEIEFIKYKTRGDYHWQGLKRNIFSFNAFLEARYKIILDQLPKLNKNKKLLDIGCGDGVLDYLIKIKKGGQIYGLDSSKEAILIAKDKFKKLKIKKCQFIMGTGYNLPFSNNNFDYAVCADVIEHVQNPDKILKEIERILKPKGKVIISSVVKLTKNPEDKMHTQEYTVEEMKKLLEKYFHKVKIISTHPLFFKKVYEFNFGVGKYKPQPLRYLINFFYMVLKDLNPFLFSVGQPTCQTGVGFKK